MTGTPQQLGTRLKVRDGQAFIPRNIAQEGGYYNVVYTVYLGLAARLRLPCSLCWAI